MKSLFMGCLLVLMLFALSCSNRDGNDNHDFSFVNEAEFYHWLNNHDWGVGASVISEKDGNLILDVLVEYYQDYSEVDFAASYSLRINGVDCVVIADAESNEVYAWDVEIPYDDEVHFVFKIEDRVIIDRTVPIPDKPVIYDTYLVDFAQDIPFHWTLEDDSQVQFLYGYVLDENDEQNMNKLLPQEARTYVLPANTFTSNFVYACGFTVEESSISEHHNNLAFVTTHDGVGYILVKNQVKTGDERKSAGRYVSPFARKRGEPNRTRY